MLFEPVRFAGVKVPGLAAFVRLMPRKIQQIPGMMNGGLGWQGIIPSRAAKMGSIAVDKGIAKLGSPADFYGNLDPEKIAEHMVRTARGDLRAVVERIVQREHPELWADLPPELRERVHARVQEQLPDIVRSVTDEIGDNIDQLVDIKLMVIRRIEETPELANRIFRSIGHKELRFIVNFGFWFGFALGVPVAFITELLLHQWFVLPIFGILIGYATNWVAIWMIFEPIEARKVWRFKAQGLFLKRQPEVSDVYAKIIADDVVTLGNIGEDLMHGPRSDRTRQMIERALRPAVDRALGRTRPLVRLAAGPREYDAIRESVATEAVAYTLTPLQDERFNRERSRPIRKLLAERMREMSPKDFSEMLRTVIREDEWLLYLHGGVLGFGGGILHLLFFG
jgi:uncharacterized membrane protein YheB (UPF0754 family)